METSTHQSNHSLVNYTFDLPEEVTEGCVITGNPQYPSSLGLTLAVPEWEAICTAIILALIIISTIVGNILVIISVFMYKPLRIVQNFFIVSSLGSFYIPLVIMTVVYFEIYLATKRRLRDRAKATKINKISSGKNRHTAKQKADYHNSDSVSSEANRNEIGVTQLVSEPESKKPNKSTLNKKPKRKYWSKDAKSQNRLNTPISSNENSVPDVSEPDIRQTSSESNPKDDIILHQASTSNQQNIVYQFIKEKQRISLTKERRAARTLGIIMGVFIVYWLPFFIIYLVTPFCISCCLSYKFSNFITWLGYINSTLNPLIYTMFNMDFRMAFKKILRKKPADNYISCQRL